MKSNGELQNKNFMNIIFIGTPEFGAIILNGLLINSSNYKPILVITTPDKPVGREQTLTPPPVKVIARKYKIPIEQPEKLQVISYKLQDLKPDLIIVAAYSQILPKSILDIPRYGCLNIHPSLLPKYRGPSPIQYAILNGDEETGVTIIKMTDKIDAGPIVAYKNFAINEKVNYVDLENKLANLGLKLLIETIPKLINRKIKPIPQNNSKATFTKILAKENGKINWQKTAEEIERQIRAFTPWPGAFTLWQKDGKLLRIKILNGRVYKFQQEFVYVIGRTLVVPQNEIAVQCGKDYLVIEKLQLEGKKEMKSEDFMRGHPDFIGTILK